MVKRSLHMFVLAACIVLAACAPRIQELGVAEDEARMAEDAFVMGDGARLPLRIWSAESPRAVFVGVHGMGDYSNALAMPGEWFAARGVTTYSYDQRGFGATEQRGVWPGSEIMVEDLKTVVALVSERHPELPVYILGISMGGAVTMKAQAQGLHAEGIVLVAPAIWGWQAMNPIYKSALWLAAHTIPSRTATGSGLQVQPSDNIDMLRAYSRDELVLRGSRIDAVYGLVTLMDEAYDAGPQLSVPVLYLYGAKDEIVPAAPTYAVMENIRAPKRLMLYQNGYHMLLRDLQRERVYEDILAWLTDREGALPSGEEYFPGDAVAAADGEGSEDAPISEGDAETDPAVDPSADRGSTPALH